MSNYMITYLGGDQPSSPEEGKRHFEQYMSWMAGLGDAVVSPANPLAKTHTINPDGSVTEGSSTAMSGYTIVQASSLEDALSMAADCPFLAIGGSLEVSEIMQMPAMG